MADNDGWTRVSGRSDETWDKTKDKEVSGTLQDIRDGVGPNGSKIYTLLKPDGKTIGVWGSALLDNRMASIPLGNEVKIVYLGLENNPKTHRKFHNFDVMTRKPSGQSKSTASNEAEVEEDVNPDDIPF